MATSLAEQAGVLTTELSLPSVFKAPQEPIVARNISPYIVFAHPKRSDEWSKLTAKFGNILEGQMFLIERDITTPLEPLKASWFCHQQYWAEKSPAGEVLRTSLTERPRPFKEHIEAVVAVYLPDRLIPANVCFRTTKCPAAKTMADTLAEAREPSWGNKSSAHAETLVCTQPFMRFYGEISLGPQRTSKTTGLPYRPTVCSVQPTGVAEWRLLKQLCDNPDSQKMLQEAADRYQERVNEVLAKSK